MALSMAIPLTAVARAVGIATQSMLPVIPGPVGGPGGSPVLPPLDWAGLVPQGLNSGISPVSSVIWYACCICDNGNVMFAGSTGYAAIRLAGSSDFLPMVRGLFTGVVTTTIYSLTPIGSKVLVTGSSGYCSVINNDGSISQSLTQGLGYPAATFGSANIQSAAHNLNTGTVIAAHNSNKAWISRSSSANISIWAGVNAAAAPRGSFSSVATDNVNTFVCVGYSPISSPVVQLYISTDDGLAFQSVSNTMQGDAGGSLCVAFSNGVWYIGTYLKLYKTTDFLTFTEITTPSTGSIKASALGADSFGSVVVTNLAPVGADDRHYLIENHGATVTGIPSLYSPIANSYSFATDNQGFWIAGQNLGYAKTTII